MPPGGEQLARDFYAGVLGMQELQKPSALAGRGGAWFAAGDVQLHLGVEEEFRPARKAHPGLLVADLAALRARLEAAGAPLADDVELSGLARLHASDPFGNRLEFLQPR